MLNKNSIFWKIIKKGNNFWLLVFVVFVLTLSIRGIKGTPTSEELNQKRWKEEGPFELSPERGRFALMYSVVEDKSLSFSLPVARFALPDLGYQDGKFVSRFAPTVSFLAIPGYFLGKSFGMAQVGTFAIISVFAFLNVLLIRSIAIRLGASRLAATVGALIFLFATPAFAYAVTLYQHHVSTFIILLSVYVLMKYKNLWSVALVWFLYAVSITVDYPNFFLMFPIGLMALFRLVFVKSAGIKIGFNIKLVGLTTFFAMVIPVLFFLWFNKESFGNPFQLSGTVPGVKNFDEYGTPLPPKNVNPRDLELYLNPETQKKTAVGFFQTRNMLNGFYTHFISPDRGIIFFTPVILFGIIGIVFLYKKKSKVTVLILAIIGTNVLLYSMWGDPGGGWAFGSRYLIPSYALMSILISFALTKYQKSAIFTLLFFLIAGYSVSVNTLGALGSNANPPKVEVLALEELSGREEKYTYERNLDLIMANKSKSFVFQTFAKDYVDAFQYYLAINQLIIFAVGLPLVFLYFSTGKEGTS